MLIHESHFPIFPSTFPGPLHHSYRPQAHSREQFFFRGRHFLRLGFSTGFRLVDVSEIVRVDADGCYSRLFFADQSSVMYSRTLKMLMNDLHTFPQFVRVHRSHVINITFIQGFRQGKPCMVELTDGSKIPVSRRKCQYFRQQLTHWKINL